MRGPKLTPVRWAFEAAESREEGWGRFERIHACGGRILTRFRLGEGDRIFLTFEAAGATFKGVPARVERSFTDDDDYSVADVRLADEVELRRLAAALGALAARVGA